MLDSQGLMWTKGKNDECLTPGYGVEPILKYIPKGAVVWCPFDRESSQFVQKIGLKNKVIFSHIAKGQDFYEYEPDEHWDSIISNPPFTNKKKIFERALSFGKPIALLMSNTWLNDSGSKVVFSQANRQMQLLLFDDRIRFNSPDGRRNDKITFSSSYYCSDFLPRDIILGGRLPIQKRGKPRRKF